MTKMNHEVQIPRFFYRDVQKAIEDLQNEAKQCGSVKMAMRQRLMPYGNQLPKGYDVDQTVNQIFETVNMFCEGEAKVSREDVRRTLEEIAGQHTEEEAFYYLSLLEAAYSAIDASADGRMDMMNAADIKAEIDNKLANPGEMCLAEQIDKMVDRICESGVKTFVFAGGSDQILSAARSKEKDGAQTVVDVLSERFDKVENYAMAACACYEQILQGKVNGLTVENSDPRIVATMVSAGLSKGTILKRLMRGEIDMELAKELLGHVETAIKWVLTRLYQVFLTLFVFTALATIVLKFVESASVLCAILMGVAAALSMGLAIFCQDDCEGVCEMLIKLSKSLLSMPVKLGRFIYKKVANHPQSRPAAQLPQTARTVQA